MNLRIKRLEGEALDSKQLKVNLKGSRMSFSGEKQSRNDYEMPIHIDSMRHDNGSSGGNHKANYQHF